MVNEFLPSKYDSYNTICLSADIQEPTFLGTSTMQLAPYREQGGTPKTLDLLGNDAVANKVVGAASTKMRRQNTKPIIPKNMYNNLMTYLEEMEWFAAYRPTLRDVNKIFQNDAIKDAIDGLDGTNLNDMIKVKLERIAARGINPDEGGKVLDFANNLFVATRLGGFKPVICLSSSPLLPLMPMKLGL